MSAAASAPERARYEMPGYPWSVSFQGWRVVALFYLLGMFTSSFDVFGVIDVGFTIRISQLFLLIPIAVGLRLALLKDVWVPLGFRSLLIWTAFILAFIPNTTYLPRNIGYAAWLVYNVILIFASVQLFNSTEQIVWVIRWYLYSFLFVAGFGLLQFALPVLGGGALLVTQWWIPDILPRINGFSYEPSYFATYLLLGWTLSVVLLQTRSVIVSRGRLWLIFSTCTLAMILSSSRSGWIMMALWCSQYPVKFVLRLLQGRVHKKLLLASAFLGLLLFVVTAAVLYVGFDTVHFLLAGTGLLGAGAFSVQERTGTLRDTIRVFLNSPIVGYSLGGVAAAIGKLRGWPVVTLADAKRNEGLCVFAEVLAASGIVGFLAFGSYIATLVIKPIQLARSVGNSQARQLLLGMLAALLLELVVLQINQNILRPYLWIHIALLSATYAVSLHHEHRRVAESTP